MKPLPASEYRNQASKQIFGAWFFAFSAVSMNKIGYFIF